MEFNFERRIAYNFMMIWLWVIFALSAAIAWIFLSKFFGKFIASIFGDVWGWIAFFVILFGIPVTIVLAFFMTISDKEVHEAKEKKKAFSEGT